VSALSWTPVEANVHEANNAGRASSRGKRSSPSSLSFFTAQLGTARLPSELFLSLLVRPKLADEEG